MNTLSAISKIHTVISECIEIAKKNEWISSYLDHIDFPVVKVDLTGKIAGIHTRLREGKDVIRINKELFEKNTDYILNQTVPHEVAHMIQYRMFGFDRNPVTGRRYCAPHGKEWKMIMNILGKEAKRCHNLDTSSLSTGRKMKHWIYKCDCMEHQITTIRHNRILKGKKYYCKKCDSVIKFVGEDTGTVTHKKVEKKDNHFYAGQSVTFKATRGRIMKGTIIRVNKKTVTIDAGQDGKWRVSPVFVINS